MTCKIIWKTVMNWWKKLKVLSYSFVFSEVRSNRIPTSLATDESYCTLQGSKKIPCSLRVRNFTWELPTTSNNQCTISFAPGLYEWIRLPNNRRIYPIGVWNLSMKCRFKVVGGAKSSTSIYRGTTWIMYGFSSCTTSWGVNKLWRTSVVFMCINLPSNSL